VQRVEQLGRDELVAYQGRRLSDLLAAIHGRNAFYTRKLNNAGLEPATLRFPADLGALPLTTKSELNADQEADPPWGTARTEPLVNYTRYCQTSSTAGHPLRWLDTNESWQWLLDCWKAVFRAARVVPGDRVFFPFSFGPFLGFWAGFEAGPQMGLQCVPGGGMSSQIRLAMIEAIGATVVCCTPTYALRLAEMAEQERRPPLSSGTVRMLIVAGEPGGSIPATRDRIEQTWGARVIDHHGLTEVGPVSFECWEVPGALHVNEGEFIAEVLDPVTGAEVPDGRTGELVVTNLGRTASPVIRYRTGDLVMRRTEACGCGRTWARLVGGILARERDLRLLDRAEHRQAQVARHQPLELAELARAVAAALRAADQLQQVGPVQLDDRLPAPQPREQVAGQRQAFGLVAGALAEVRRDERLHDPAVEQVAAQRHAAGGEHLRLAAGRAGDRDVERAAAEVEDEEALVRRERRLGRVVVRRGDGLLQPSASSSKGTA